MTNICLGRYLAPAKK